MIFYGALNFNFLETLENLNDFLEKEKCSVAASKLTKC